MKSLLFVFLAAVCLVYGQENLSTITRAIGSGDVQSIEPFLDNTVEISILDKTKVCNKSEALEQLTGFFQSNPARSFNQVHKGASRSKDSLYSIGNLNTQNGSFRVYIYVKLEGLDYYIQEIRFDRE